MAKKEVKTLNKKEKNGKDKTSFFKGFKAELKKVSWPTPKQLINNTTAVIVIVLILSAIVFVLDFAFEAANKYGIDKIKETVISTEKTNEGTDNNTTEGTNAEATNTESKPAEGTSESKAEENKPAPTENAAE